MKKTLLIIVILITELITHGSLIAKKNSNIFLNQTENEIPFLGNVMFFRTGWEIGFPALELNSEHSLTLIFDILNSSSTDLYYSISQYDAKWEKTNPNENEYLDGFNNQMIENYNSSLNTTADYVNYQLEIPNDNIQILQSGNYTINIFSDSDLTNQILSERFVAFQSQVSIAGSGDSYKNPMGGEIQSVNLNVEFSNLNVITPEEDIKLAYLVNSDWNTFIFHTNYRILSSTELECEFDKAIQYQGQNEYRYFDNRDFKQRSERVERIEFKPPYYHFTLKEDRPKKFNEYFFVEDINGQFLLDQGYRWNDKHTEADYTWVHFNLKVDRPYLSRVHVYGALTNWTLNESNELMYNPVAEAYTGKLFLKQGHYDYRYVMKDFDSNEIDWSLIEGSHSQTENQVYVFFYYKSYDSEYERLAGYEVISPMQKQ